MTKLKLNQDVLFKNNLIADEIRYLLKSKNITSFNIMASPGAGKTSLILAALRGIKQPSLVIEGDIASTIDTDKIIQQGFEAIQINTGGSCHLTASMIKKALLNLKKFDYRIIYLENVGNLVCPAPYDLGETYKIVISSVPEGDDKPLKYPNIFSVADAILLNKTDLLGFINFDINYFISGVRSVNKKAPIIHTSCTTSTGLEEWTNWIISKLP